MWGSKFIPVFLPLYDRRLTFHEFENSKNAMKLDMGIAPVAKYQLKTRIWLVYALTRRVTLLVTLEPSLLNMRCRRTVVDPNEMFRGM